MPDMFYLVGWNQIVAVVMGLAVWLACRTRTLSRRPAVCHGLWLLVLLKLVTPPIVPVPVLPAIAAAKAEEKPTPPAVPPSAAAAAAKLECCPPVCEESKAITVANETHPASADLAAYTCPRFAPTDAPPSSSIPDPPVDASANNFASPQTLAALLGVNLLISCAIAVAAARRLRYMRRLMETSPTAIGRAAELLRQVSRRFNSPAAAKLHIVDAPVAPMLWAGPGGPAIVLPRQLVDSLSDDDVRNIIAHELGHYTRRDHWVNLFAFVVTTLLWWNPIAWLARRQLSAAAEACCDAVALAQHVVAIRVSQI